MNILTTAINFLFYFLEFSLSRKNKNYFWIDTVINIIYYNSPFHQNKVIPKL